MKRPLFASAILFVAALLPQGMGGESAASTTENASNEPEGEVCIIKPSQGDDKLAQKLMKAYRQREVKTVEPSDIGDAELAIETVDGKKYEVVSFTAVKPERNGGLKSTWVLHLYDGPPCIFTDDVGFEEWTGFEFVNNRPLHFSFKIDDAALKQFSMGFMRTSPDKNFAEKPAAFYFDYLNALILGEDSGIRFDLEIPGGTVAQFNTWLQTRFNEAYQRLPKIMKSRLPSQIVFSYRSDDDLNKCRLAPMNLRKGNLKDMESIFASANGNCLDSSDMYLKFAGYERMGSPLEISMIYSLANIESGVKIYNLNLLRERHPVEDIVSLMQSAWEVMGQATMAEIKYHKPTNVLIIKGSAGELKMADAVYSSLGGEISGE